MSTDSIDLDPLQIHVDGVPDVGTWVTVVDADGELTLLPARRRSTPKSSTLSVDERAFRSLVRTLIGEVPVDLVAEHGPVDVESVQFWRTYAAYIRASEPRDGTVIANALLRQARFQEFVVAVLAVFPVAAHGVELQPPIALPAALRRAMQHMEEHVREGVHVEEVAAAAGLSVRGLQAAFRRSLDRTPLEHLRLLRLQHAHDELITADTTDGTTIEAVAARWGFSSSGRFAAAYRKEYGVLPSVTLRQ
jgi:AraC-like DNA-binding protein